MFRILCDPSSGSTELCLTGNTRSGSLIFRHVLDSVFGSVLLNLWCVCLYGPAGRPAGRPDRTHTPQVQNYAAKHRQSTRQNICEPLRVFPVKHSSVLPDDGSHKIRNMSE